MFKKMALTILCVSGIISSTNALAEQPSENQGITIDFKLTPNNPQKFTNTAFWPIEASCKMSTSDSSGELYLHVLKKSGKVNGTKLSAGKSISMAVHSGQKINLSAESGAQVEITNKGSHTITASCTA